MTNHFWWLEQIKPIILTLQRIPINGMDLEVGKNVNFTSQLIEGKYYQRNMNIIPGCCYGLQLTEIIGRKINTDTSPRIYPWRKQRILSLFQAPGFRHGVDLKSKIHNPFIELLKRKGSKHSTYPHSNLGF